MNSLNCPNRNELLAYEVGKLSDPRYEAVDQHLLTCDRCQVELSSGIGERDVLVEHLHLPEVNAPHELAPACIRAIARSKDAVSKPTENWHDAKRRMRQLPRVLAEYEVLEKLGEGGMGVVYKARHTKLRKVVALKILSDRGETDERAVARFQREMQAVGAVDHAHIVRALDAREVEGMHFLVMEYVDGLDFARIVQSLGQIPIACACELIRQAALGLQHIHKHGLVHRDIKPSNLVLGRDGQVKILDLGLALLRSHSRDSSTELTETGQIVGTLDYIAPEQVCDRHEIGGRADIYSLGATLYKLLTGRVPFADHRQDSPEKRLVALVTEEVPSIKLWRPELSDDLARTIHRMLAREPNNRFAEPSEVAAALAPFTSGSDLTALLADAEQSPNRSGPNHGAPLVPQNVREPVAEWIDHRQRPPDRPDSNTPRHRSTRLVVAVLLGCLVICSFGVALWRSSARQSPNASSTEGVNSATLSTPRDDNVSKPVEHAASDVQRLLAEQLALPVEFTNAIGMEMMLIPPGEFLYGSPADEQGRDHMDLDQRRERATTPFYIGKFEVTRRQWQQLLGPDSTAKKDDLLDAPVKGISFLQASDFVELLSERTGMRYRMPTEIEWEYACRAGTTAPYYCRFSSFLPEHEWMGEATGTVESSVGPDGKPMPKGILFEGKPHEVGQKKPNPWGLFDMLGNVNEWCDGPAEGPWGGADKRALRGGCVQSAPTHSRCASRYPTMVETTVLTGFSNFIAGFRVVIDADEAKKLPDAALGPKK